MKSSHLLSIPLLLFANSASAHGLGPGLVLFLVAYLFWPLLLSLLILAIGLYKMFRRKPGAKAWIAIAVATMAIQVPWHYATQHLLH